MDIGDTELFRWYHAEMAAKALSVGDGSNGARHTAYATAYSHGSKWRSVNYFHIRDMDACGFLDWWEPW